MEYADKWEDSIPCSNVVFDGSGRYNLTIGGMRFREAVEPSVQYRSPTCWGGLGSECGRRASPVRFRNSGLTSIRGDSSLRIETGVGRL